MVNLSRRTFSSLAHITAFWSLAGYAFVVFTPAARAETQTLYNIYLDGYLWGNEVSSGFQLDDRYRFSQFQLGLTAPFARFDAGAVAANFDTLSFAERSFQGFKLRSSLGNVDATILGGSVVLPNRLGGQEISPVYGLRLSRPFNDRLRLSATQLFVPRATRDQGPTISAASLLYETGSPQRMNRLAFEIARSRHGTGWQVSGGREGRRLAIAGSYRQASPGFSTAGNPLLLTNRNGYFANLRYNTKPLTFSANTQRYTDGFGGNSRADAAALTLALRKLPSITLSWRSSASASLAANRSGIAVTSAGLGLSYALGRNTLLFQYDRQKLSFSSMPFSNMSGNRVFLGFVRPLGTRTLLAAFYFTDKNSVVLQNTTLNSSSVVVDVNHRLKYRDITLNLGLEGRNTQVNDRSGQSTLVRMGINWPLGAGSSIGLQYRMNAASSGLLSVEQPNLLYVTYRRRFQIGPRRRGDNLSEDQRRRLSNIVGRIFEDRNNNLRWDKGEPGLSGIEVSLNNSILVKSGTDGTYAIKSIDARRHNLRMISKDIPLELTTLTPTDVVVNTVAGKSSIVDFVVARTGQVTGIVFLDENRNGIRDGWELGVADAVVQVSGTGIIGFTAADGSFTLSSVPPKTWQVLVDIQSLNGDYEATGLGFAPVTVLPNGTISGIALGIAPREEPIINTFEGTGRAKQPQRPTPQPQPTPSTELAPLSSRSRNEAAKKMSSPRVTIASMKGDVTSRPAKNAAPPFRVPPSWNVPRVTKLSSPLATPASTKGEAASDPAKKSSPLFRVPPSWNVPRATPPQSILHPIKTIDAGRGTLDTVSSKISIPDRPKADRTRNSNVKRLDSASETEVKKKLATTGTSKARLKQLWAQGAAAKHRGDFVAARQAWQAALTESPGHPGFQESIDALPR